MIKVTYKFVKETKNFPEVRVDRAGAVVGRALRARKVWAINLHPRALIVTVEEG